jgi:hypothetical protein
MGYYSSFRGHLDITSSRQHPQELMTAAANAGYPLKDIGAIPDEALTALKANSHYSRFFDLTTSCIIAGNGEPGTAPKNLIQELVADITQALGTVNGEIVRIGEEQGDLEKFTIVNNKITVDTAKLVWASDNSTIPYHLHLQ